MPMSVAEARAKGREVLKMGFWRWVFEGPGEHRDALRDLLDALDREEAERKTEKKIICPICCRSIDPPPGKTRDDGPFVHLTCLAEGPWTYDGALAAGFDETATEER